MSACAHPASLNLTTASSRMFFHSFERRARICERSNSVFPHITSTCAFVEGSSAGASSPSFGAGGFSSFFSSSGS